MSQKNSRALLSMTLVHLSKSSEEANTEYFSLLKNFGKDCAWVFFITKTCEKHNMHFKKL